MLLVLDHRDSFTWNLVHALARTGAAVRVLDASGGTSVHSVKALRPQAIVFSPGPGHPRDAHGSLALARELAGELPMLGVCLGHQVICTAFGARVVHAPDVRHGRTSCVSHAGRGLFAGLPSPFRAARYHSLVVEPDSLPPGLIASAWADSGELMAVEHETWPLWAVQFHPESFLTEHGQQVIENFLDHVRRAAPLQGAAR